MWCSNSIVSDTPLSSRSSSLLRVLLVTGEYPPMRGGVGDYSALLRDALLQQRIDVLVLTSTKAGPARSSFTPATTQNWGETSPISHPGEDRSEGQSIFPRITRWDFHCLGELDAAIAATRPDIVHIQYQAGAFDLHPAIPLWPLRTRTRRSRPRIVITFHDLLVPYMFPKAGPLRRLAIQTFAAAADRVVVTNDEDARRLRWLGSRVSLIPIGSNIPVVSSGEAQRKALRHRYGVADDEVVLGYFGFLTPSKGVDVLLKSLPLLERDGVRARLLMIGGSDTESAAANRDYDRLIREMAAASTLREKVLWTGFTSPEDVSANLQAVDLCVLPFREGAALRHGTLVAALVHGLPIVTTASPASPTDRPELVGGKHAALVPPDDSAALARALATLARDPAQRARLADGARSLGERFRWDHIAAAMVNIYREMLL